MVSKILIACALVACASLAQAQQLSLTEALPTISFNADHSVKIGATANALKIEAPGGFWVNGRDVLATVSAHGGDITATNADALGTTPTVELTDGALSWTANTASLALSGAVATRLTAHGKVKVGTSQDIEALLAATVAGAGPGVADPGSFASGVELEGAAGEVSFTASTLSLQREVEDVLVFSSPLFVNGVDVIAAIASIPNALIPQPPAAS